MRPSIFKSPPRRPVSASLLPALPASDSADLGTSARAQALRWPQSSSTRRRRTLAPFSMPKGFPQQLPSRDAHTHPQPPCLPEGQTGGTAQRPRPGRPPPLPAGKGGPSGVAPVPLLLTRVHLTVEGHKCFLSAPSASRSPALSWSRHFPGPATT